MRIPHTALVAISAAGLLAAPAAMAESYVVLAKHQFASGFAADVAAAGGHITTFVPEIGLAIVDSTDPDFRSKGGRIDGVHAVAANISMRMLEPNMPVMLSFDEAFANPPVSGDDDFYFNLQWGHAAIDAASAWNAGYRGAGVRVAVLDSGIDAEHPDLAPNLNTALSASFVPGEDWNVQPGFYFNHGTHVAGTIAAADNGYGSIGVAPEAELVAVKVLSEVSGSGSFGGIAAGMVYAANIGADVINMSLGATIPSNCTFDILDENDQPTGETEHFPAADCAAIVDLLRRAANYAHGAGSTIISSAGNEATDMDHNGSVVKLPAELPGVISISALGPVGWAKDPVNNTDFDNLASYSNYGRSGIDFGAPGGDFVYPGNEACVVGGVLQACWVFDMVFSTISGGWSWSAGTSMAAPHASGVAALIIGKNGGSMSPVKVEAALRSSSLDLGQPGNDAIFGQGRVDAASAIAN